jgi:hypothetical protein
MQIERNIMFWLAALVIFAALLLLAAASGMLIRFALRRYLASPYYTGNPPT